MIALIFGLCLASFLLSWAGTWSVRRMAVRWNFVDKPGHRKIHSQPIALGGGIAIFWAFILPMLAALLYARLPIRPFSLSTHVPVDAIIGGIRMQTPLAVSFLLACAAMHLLGLCDDRKAMGPFIKLFIQLGIVAGLVLLNKDLRAVTAFGPIISVTLTILWIATVTNAFNFLDNMDGLSAGIAAVCTTAFLVTALIIQQWFVAASLALLLGALLGFLCFNFSPASIFMGDSGSLLIGLILGVLTVRTTFLRPGQNFGAGWYAVFAPLIVLAVPLYDFFVVTVIRMSRGKSPFVGDTNHFSHRLVARGMSKRTAVLCLYLLTAATAIAAIILPFAPSAFVASLIFGQTLLILGVVALLEQHPPSSTTQDVSSNAAQR